MEIETPPINRGRPSRKLRARGVRHGRRVEPRRAARKRICDRREPLRAGMGKCAEDLREQRPVIARLDGVEGARAISDDPSENVDPAGRALGIGGGGETRWQSEIFGQFRDIDAPVSSTAPRARSISCRASARDPSATCARREETGPHSPGAPPKPQIQAGGLDLVFDKGSGGSIAPALARAAIDEQRKCPALFLSPSAKSRNAPPVARRRK